MVAVRDTPRRQLSAPSVSLGARRVVRWQAAVVVAALATRLGVLFRHGWPRGSFGYDSAVYFAASDALVHGRVPYRDFVLLHPPALMLALTPFAALTRLWSDPTCLAVAAIFFAVLGAVNAGLVMLVCRRLGFGPRGAVVGGAFYAVWFGAVRAEYLSRLEPLGNFLLLVGVLLLLAAQERRLLRYDLGAGVALGALVSTKIWWAVPVVVLVGWHVRRRRSRSGSVSVLAGVLVAVAAIDLPFFLLAPRAMWTSVVVDQLGRQPGSRLPFPRLADIGPVSALTIAPSPTAVFVSAVVTVALAAVLARAAWRLPIARPFVVLLGVQGVVVLASPSWFGFYTDFLAVAAAITVGAAAAAARRRTMPLGRAVVAGAAVLTASAIVIATSGVRPTPGAPDLARATSDVPCVMSDSPMGQIELNALTRGLERGCPNWVDVTGRTYGPDRAPVPRLRNERWQRDLRAYLRSGQAVVVVRPTGTGLDAETWAAVRRDGVLARSRGLVVYRVSKTN